MKRKALIFCGIILTFLIFVGWEWISAYSLLKQIQLPEVARYLSSDSQKARDEFSKRVQKRYPVGILETDLVSKLATEGFEIYPNIKQANAVSQGIPCALDHWIVWKTNDKHFVSEINGSYGYFCL